MVSLMASLIRPKSHESFKLKPGKHWMNKDIPYISDWIR